MLRSRNVLVAGAFCASALVPAAANETGLQTVPSLEMAEVDCPEPFAEFNRFEKRDLALQRAQHLICRRMVTIGTSLHDGFNQDKSYKWTIRRYNDGSEGRVALKESELYGNVEFEARFGPDPAGVPRILVGATVTHHAFGNQPGSRVDLKRVPEWDIEVHQLRKGDMGWGMETLSLVRDVRDHNLPLEDFSRFDQFYDQTGGPLPVR